MAKRSAGAMGGVAPLPPDNEESSITPEPPPNLRVTLITLTKGARLHRVHLSKYQAVEFNPGVQGNARFSPVRDGDGKSIPTLYGGSTMVCALMETVFHDVPHSAGFKSFDKGKLMEQQYSTIRVEQDLQLVNLASVALRKMGVTRKQLIDTEKDQYPACRKWAEAIHLQCPQAQGLSWISRQDDSARAVVLFGDRIAEGVLQSAGACRSLLDDAAAYDEVVELAAAIGVNIVQGLA